MQTYAALLLALTSFTTGHASAPEVPAVDAQWLADQIETANELIDRDFETTFEFRWLKARPTDDDQPWDLDEWRNLETFRYIVADDRLFIQRDSFAQPESPENEPEMGYQSWHVWADGDWIMRTDRDPDAVNLMSQPAPTDLLSNGFIFNLMEGRFPSYRTLADLVRTGTVLEQSVEDGILDYRFAKDDMPASRVQYVIRVRVEPVFELIGYTVSVSNATEIEHFQRDLTVSRTYEVLRWRQVDGVRIPEVAETYSVSPSMNEKHHAAMVKGRSIYTRLTFREIEEPDDEITDLLTPKMPVGTKVYDERINASFEIGNTYLKLDGVMYDLDEPITEHPRDGLGDLIRQSSAADLLRPAPAASEASGGDDTQDEEGLPKAGLSPILVSALAGLGIALLVLAVLRIRRAG